MARPSKAVINLEALRNNYALSQRCHGGKVLAVLKADAYGHGAVACATALQGRADGFAVAFADEAFSLLKAGIREPILVLEGAFDAGELNSMREAGLWTVVHHEAQLRAIEQLRPSGPLLQAWLKIDTGMNRAGFPTTQANSAHARLRNCAAVAGITLMTHFSRADELDVDTTERQISRFDACTAGIDGPRSLCNSAGLLAWPHGRRDWGRCGIALYGADPLAAKGGSPEGLQPVMTLKSRVFATKQLRAGDALGYGEGFIADRPMRVGLVAVGYADGYPRSAQTGTPVNVDGEPTRLVGRVSMDMLSIDLTDLPQTGIGSEVELWGQQVDVNAVAQCAGTIAYEVLCNVKRVDRVYLDESQ